MNSKGLVQLEYRLKQGLETLGVSDSPSVQQSLLAYLYLLEKWNKHFNLTAVKTCDEMLTVHLFDSLSILLYLQGQTLLDIGCGAGLPGIPLAICRPDISVTLLDSNGKKTRFCQQAIAELNLNNINVVKSRVQEYRPRQGFDTVISRAFADLESMYTQSIHLCHPDGVMLAMKGRYPEVEISALERHTKLKATHKLVVPGLEMAERHLICF